MKTNTNAVTIMSPVAAEYLEKITHVCPSKSINGFTIAKMYPVVRPTTLSDCRHYLSISPMAIEVLDDNNHPRFISLDTLGMKSAHLWNGTRWNRAGHFKGYILSKK